MKKLYLYTLIIGLTICCSGKPNSTSTEFRVNNLGTVQNLNDKEEIQNLIRQVLKWADSENSIDLLPVLTDSNDSIYIGFNLEKHKENLNKLKATDFFASEFIENYNQIILTLDKGLKTGLYDEWLVGDLPTFIFSNDYNPWWDGQEWFLIENGIVEQINLDNNDGDFYFVCDGKKNECDGLENYKMKFKVIKESDKWKISYLHGFDFKESTRKDGQL